jgi:DNA-binding NarL/FixJ family response regulator
MTGVAHTYQFARRGRGSRRARDGRRDLALSAAVSPRTLCVLVADDHAPTRDAVRQSLRKRGIRVCAEASNAVQAVQLALETKPDICLLEVRMPGGGVAAAWEIAARVPTTKIVMLTVSDADVDFFGALRAGAVGYLVKDIDLCRLPRALRDVAEGTPAISPPLIGRMLAQFRSKEPRFRMTGVATDHGRRLTSREWDVLAALAEGLSTRAIARRLQITPSAVRCNISHLLRKLGLGSRDEAVSFFRETSAS